MANESTREYDQRAEKAGGMKVLTPADVAEILTRCEKATPGPWEIRCGGNFTDIGGEFRAGLAGIGMGRDARSSL